MKWIDEEVSIGDYVLTGGELPAMVVTDAMARFVPGVVGDPDSVLNDSFSAGLLDTPHYTRPSVWRGRKVPAVLLSGNHQAIRKWREEKAWEVTRNKKPALVKSRKRN
jgi:tRNA (guanine37-N1)-methyltransferase